MTPIPLTPGKERVLAAWRERPGTLADLARRTGVSPSAISRALVRLRGWGLLPSAPRPGALPRPGARVSEGQYSLSQRAAWRTRTWIEDRILAPGTHRSMSGRPGTGRDAFIDPGSPRGGIWRPSGVRV